MKTLKTALIWAEQQTDKSLDFDRRWGAQCLDLYAYYWQLLGLSIQWVAKACELWDRDVPGTRKTNIPTPGAVAVYSSKVANGYGTCGIVLRVFADGTFDMQHQNPKGNLEKGGPCVVQRRNMKDVLGFIVPEFLSEPSAPPPAPSAPKKSNDDIAREVVRGDWGNGEDRKKRLAAAGYDYGAVQAIVNSLVAAPAAPAPVKPTPDSTGRTYTIQPGESYWSIETKFNIPHGTLEKMNPWPARQIPKFAQVKLPN